MLGRGGFAIVVKAFDDALQSAVAIKILDADMALDVDIAQRFHSEGQLLRRVDHPNVVPIHDLGTLDDGRPYYVMPFAGGGVLSERAPSGPGMVTPQDLGRLIDQLAGGVAALHKAGVVHRDIKPGNLLIAGTEEARGDGATGIRRGLLGAEERVLLCDLGLAKVLENTAIGTEGRQATILGGSLHYRAPEQSQLGAEITPATDIYACSGVLWNLLTGEPPPQPGDVESSSVGIPNAWQEFFERGLAARPDGRFPSIEAWAQAARNALAAESHVGFAPSVAGTICPFKGLAAYQPEDAEFFFGRERLVDELVAKLQAHPLLVIGGSSGSGKSSLMRAGLLAALARGALPGSQNWKVILFAPGREPLKHLRRQLAHVGEPSSTVGSGVVVAIDQFEEIFTGDGRPAEFVSELAELSEDHQGRVRIILATRADFYGECSRNPWLADAINRNSVLVGPLSRSELRAAVEGPARRAGLGLEAGLVDKILEQAPDDAGSLPLIAHALMETWLRRRKDLLTVNGLEAAGGVGGAIAQTADHTYDGLDDTAKAVMRSLFLDLVNAGDNTPDTRRTVALAELRADSEMLAMAERLADARLLTIDATTVQLAHEALISTWPRLQGWIDQARDDLRLRERVERACAAWAAEDENSDLLYRGTALANALEHHDAARFTESQQRFLDASAKAEQAELDLARAEESRRQRLRRRVVVGMAVLTALAVAASFVAFLGLQRARDSEQLAIEQFLGLMASQAQSLQGSDPLTAVMLSAESLARTEMVQATSQATLAQSRQALSKAKIAPVGAPILVSGGTKIAMSPNGQWIAVGSRQGRISIVSVATREVVSVINQHDAGIVATRFSPDSSILATSDSDGFVWLWNVPKADSQTQEFSPVRTEAILNVGRPVWGLAFSIDGQELVATTENGRMLLVDLARPEQDPRTLWSGTEDLLSVAISPDGESIAIGAGTGIVRVIDKSSGALVFANKFHSSKVWQVTFTQELSPLLVSVSAETIAQDGQTGELIGTIFGSASQNNGVWIKAVALTRNGIVGGAGDGTMWLRPAEGQGLGGPATLLGAGHEDGVSDAGVAASAAGQLVASLSDDGEMQLWTTTPDEIETVAVTGQDAFGLAADGTANQIAVGADGVVRTLDRDGTLVAELPHDGKVLASPTWLIA